MSCLMVKTPFIVTIIHLTVRTASDLRVCKEVVVA
jgi:hypothetical protein